jgi:hypothetical protein
MSSSKPIVYSVHPAVATMQDVIAKMPQKTGKTLYEWAELVKRSPLASSNDKKAWLKAEFGLGTNYAMWIVDFAEGTGEDWWAMDDPKAYVDVAYKYVEAMFDAKKAHLRPIYERLMRIAQHFGSDVKFCPTKTYVPFYRHYVFAQAKPTTAKRLDVGLSLGDPKQLPAVPRLIETGGFAKKDRITHRIALASVDEVDDEVEHWLREAYERDKQ